jgi:hypothetical protein
VHTDFTEGREGNKGDGKNATYAERIESWGLTASDRVLQVTEITENGEEHGILQATERTEALSEAPRFNVLT